MKIKVLMALMCLEIGGAETHVLELCKELKRRGVDVYVASNGGVYERELSECGIVHFKIPMHNKLPGNLLKSYNLLKKVIIDNDFKLVHAHARIPAFLCGMLQKKLHFRFMTTTHWVFNTALPYRILTNWGEKSLAVSEDIKEYLIKKYGLSENDIGVTINGIDTEKFSPDIDSGNLCSELGLSPNTIKLVIISRQDKSRSLSAHRLIEAAEQIYRHNPNIEIVIVGPGDDFNEVKAKAEAVNKKLGKNIVHMAGGRSDINKCVALADIYIGVSRSVMEAMAGAKPCIMAGNEGYVGIFDEDKLETAINTNFCFRGCPETTANELAKDVITLLDMSKEKKARLGEFGRNVIKERYSVGRMADDACAMYESLRVDPRKIDILVSGYYGYGNNGDDVVLKAIVDSFRRINPGLRIIVLSIHPRETEKKFGVEAVNKLNLYKIFKILGDTKMLVTGGGTLIQDLTSSRSLIYYLMIINIAIKRRVRTMLYSSGIGPVLSSKNKPMVRRTLNKVDLIAVRDPDSLEILKNLQVDKPPIVFTADIVFDLETKNADAGRKKLESLGIKDIDNYFCIAVRQWKNISQNFEKDIASFADYIIDKFGYAPVFVIMQPSLDTEITKRIIGLMKGKSYLTDTLGSFDEVFGIVGRARFVVGMRLHTLIYAVKSGAPVIGLVYDPKVRAFLEMINQRRYCSVSDLQLDALKCFADEIMSNREKISSQIIAASLGIKEKALQNTELALELLNRKLF